MADTAAVVVFVGGVIWRFFFVFVFSLFLSAKMRLIYVCIYTEGSSAVETRNQLCNSTWIRISCEMTKLSLDTTD